MMRQLFLLRGLLDTGPVCEPLSVVRDGFVNFYAVRGPSGVVCVDAGWRRVGVARGFGALDLDIGDIKAVFLTHLHWDHARGMRLYPNAELFIGARERPSLFSARQDPSRPLTMLTDGQTITVAGLRVHAIETPGHTAGSVCYVINERFLFTGDTLRLRHGEVVPFWPWLIGDRTTMERSLRRLASLNGIEYILTAHTGATSEVAAAFRRWREPARLEERQP
jgi:glyoxylase-like metal-dependent hydrolase (beta-lactamase superfamily II)